MYPTERLLDIWDTEIRHFGATNPPQSSQRLRRLPVKLTGTARVRLHLNPLTMEISYEKLDQGEA